MYSFRLSRVHKIFSLNRNKLLAMSSEAAEATASQGGRPTAKFVDAHFKKKHLQDNKSRKWVVSCNYCKAELLHRDNRCAHHISNRKECPDAPEFARQQALFKLKNAKQSEEDPADILKSAPEPKDGDTAGGKPVKRARQEDGKLTSYLERPLDQRIQDEIDLKILR